MATTATSISRNLESGRLQPGGADRGVNVSEPERWLSLIGGGALALYGLSRRDLPGLGCAALGGGLFYVGLTGRCDVYRALGINTAEHHGEAASVAANRGVKVVRNINIDRPPTEVYRAWRDFKNLPHFMKHLKSVTVDGQRSHWTAQAPAGTEVEWDAEIINDQPNRLIAWRSLADSCVATAGSVHFTPAANGRGTNVLVELKYDPPAGRLGSWLAWLFGEEPGLQIREDLLRFKQLMEGSETRTAGRQPAFTA